MSSALRLKSPAPLGVIERAVCTLAAEIEVVVEVELRWETRACFFVDDGRQRWILSFLGSKTYDLAGRFAAVADVRL